MRSRILLLGDDLSTFHFNISLTSSLKTRCNKHKENTGVFSFFDVFILNARKEFENTTLTLDASTKHALKYSFLPKDQFSNVFLNNICGRKDRMNQSVSLRL